MTRPAATRGVVRTSPPLLVSRRTGSGQCLLVFSTIGSNDGDYVTTNELFDGLLRMRQLRGHMVRNQFRLSLVPGRLPVSLSEHLAIIDAICARDPERAGQAMRAHLDSVLTTLTDVLTPSGAPAG